MGESMQNKRNLGKPIYPNNNTYLRKRVEEIVDHCMETDNIMAIIKKGVKPKYKLNEKFLVDQLLTLVEERDKDLEKACRLYLQDTWNDQSEIQALSPDGKIIIWGGIIGKEITKEWLKIKAKLKLLSQRKKLEEGKNER